VRPCVPLLASAITITITLTFLCAQVNDPGGHHAVNDALVDFAGSGSLLQRLSPKKTSSDLLSNTFPAAAIPDKGQVGRPSPLAAAVAGDLSYTSGQFFSGTVILPNRFGRPPAR
jgi:hypothetical protein